MKKKLVIGILAHVDAGKTTLTESLLYHAGMLRRMGRVDHGDAFLDNNALEQARGITIFAKQAILGLQKHEITILDTPGHVDFSAEMERTLPVLDYAVLVISATEGVQAHTRTLWRLLEFYHIPVFLFINKMDQPGADRENVLKELKAGLSENIVDFTDSAAAQQALAEKQAYNESFFEAAAMCKESLLEKYLEGGVLSAADITGAITERCMFPCFFGSALKSEGVAELLEGMDLYMQSPDYPDTFGARVFKIIRDEQGNRLTYLKVTGGVLRVKTAFGEEEKINQIRVYSGLKFETVTEAEAGTICAVTGLQSSRAGSCYGIEKQSRTGLLEPVLVCRMNLPEGCSIVALLPKLRQLEEENPELHIVWNEALQELQLKIMGEVQTEILQSLIKERFGLEVSFGPGNIVYKETIANTVEGVGHYEPLRHYSEVHLLLEPGKRGSGMVFASDCSEDELEKNWQRLILTHLQEREHAGVLTGSALTDVKITLIAGRAHKKHTEGSDFRQATYRAVRQGLMQAESVLLEPYYDFYLEIPRESLGRAMTDLEQRGAKTNPPELFESMAVLTGIAPVSQLRGYAAEVITYTKGLGRLASTVRGYDICHNPEEVMEKAGYDAERDLQNPASSVFCAHGAGFLVEWDRVKEFMHLEGWKGLRGAAALNREMPQGSEYQTEKQTKPREERFLGTDEVDAILAKATLGNRREVINRRFGWNKKTPPEYSVSYGRKENPADLSANRVSRNPGKPQKARPEYLLVDGYNIVFAWEELRGLARDNIDGARGRLMDILCNYQAIRGCNLIVVFDAYRVQGHPTEQSRFHNINVVFTKEAETADQYIEAFAQQRASEFDITVATSDHLEQMIIFGAGCRMVNADEFRERILREEAVLREQYLSE